MLTAFLTSGCKREVSQQSYGYFKTPFQSETEFIIDAIVSDLGEQVYYAATHQVPDAKRFSVTATEKPGFTIDAPIYSLLINLDKKHRDLKLDLVVNGPIWSPEIFGNVVETLAGSMGLKAAPATETDDTTLVSDLLDGTAMTLEQNNQNLSEALANNFTNPQLHEEAALLLGAFALREHSGHFFEIRSPLSRLTAHLAMARFLRGSDSAGLNGKLAHAVMLTLVCDQAPALQELSSIDSKDAFVTGFIRALQARNTGDFRPLSKVVRRSDMEGVAWFAAMADYGNSRAAWLKLDETQKQNINYVRAAQEMPYSVETGHELLRLSLPLELREIQDVYNYSHAAKLTQSTLTNALNEPPERCFTTEPDKKTRVRIIGWGQWAMFFQRQLCYAVQQNFHFMNWQWGVPEDAKKFGEACDRSFGPLRLYPFVRRFNCTNVDDYHKAVDDAFKVTVATPNLVPAQCWNYLCYKVPFAPLYTPNPNPHINEWHSHNPPPGTVYNIQPRLNHPSLVGRRDALARFEELHELAPYDNRIINYIFEKKFNDNPSFDQAMSYFRDVLPWSVYAMKRTARTAYDQPAEYEKLMLQAADIDPSAFYDLSDYAWRHDQEDKAVQYMEKACDNDPDAISVASHAKWRVCYYLKQGQADKAREIADAAGKVYSSSGLIAKAVFMECTSNYDGAFEWYAKNEERYGYSAPLIAFCQRYKALTGDIRFDSELKKREGIVFPQGMEKVSLAEFTAPPADGVIFKANSDLLLAWGLKQGDVIVALKSIRVHTEQQYTYLRDSQQDPVLDLIMWQDGTFNEIKASPTNHQFGVDIGDYKSN